MAARGCANRGSVKLKRAGNPVPSRCGDAAEGQEIRAYPLLPRKRMKPVLRRCNSGAGSAERLNETMI